MPEDFKQNAALARTLSQRFTDCLEIVQPAPGTERAGITIAEVLRNGAFFTKLLHSAHLASGGRLQPDDEELFSILLTRPLDSEKLHKLLIRRLEQGCDSGPALQEVLAEVTAFLNAPFSPRRFVAAALREAFPPGTPGRKRKISPEQWPVLLERSQQLQPAIRANPGAPGRAQTQFERVPPLHRS